MRLFVFIGVLALLPVTAYAKDPLFEAFRPAIRGGITVHSFTGNVLTPMRVSNPTHRLLVQADIEACKQREIEYAKKEQVDLFIRYDANKDTNVTEKELRDGLNAQFANRRVSDAKQLREINANMEKHIQQMMSFDTNRDKVVTHVEMTTLSPTLKNVHGMSDILTRYLALDPNRDGQLTIEELEALAAKAWAKLDKDKDNNLTEAEASVAY